MSRAEAGIKTLKLRPSLCRHQRRREPDGTVDARLYWKPLVAFIWIGALIMGFGGLCLAVRPAAAHRRRASRPQSRRAPQAGGMRARARNPRACRRSCVAPLLARAVRAGRKCCPDPRLEARARAISAGLALSRLPERIDRRIECRLWRMISASSSASVCSPATAMQQIRDFLVSRYGNFILLKPPFEPRHLSSVADAVSVADRGRRRDLSQRAAQGGELPRRKS